MAWASAIAGSLGSIWGCCPPAGLLGICWLVQSLQQATWTAGGAGGWDRGVGWGAQKEVTKPSVGELYDMWT